MASYSDTAASKLQEMIKKKNTKKQLFVPASTSQPLAQKQAEDTWSRPASEALMRKWIPSQEELAAAEAAKLQSGFPPVPSEFFDQRQKDILNKLTGGSSTLKGAPAFGDFDLTKKIPPSLMPVEQHLDEISLTEPKSNTGTSVHAPLRQPSLDFSRLARRMRPIDLELAVDKATARQLDTTNSSLLNNIKSIGNAVTDPAASLAAILNDQGNKDMGVANEVQAKKLTALGHIPGGDEARLASIINANVNNSLDTATNSQANNLREIAQLLNEDKTHSNWASSAIGWAKDKAMPWVSQSLKNFSPRQDFKHLQAGKPVDTSDASANLQKLLPYLLLGGGVGGLSWLLGRKGPKKQKEAMEKAAYCYGFFNEALASGLTEAETIELLKTTING